jgi:F-type H+-transporting ATPase subunit b
LIDWFTVLAQIVNFLVLVYLLKRFLYKPIIRAMDERERRIAAHLQEAEKREGEARQELQQYETKNREIDSQREALVSQIKDEVEIQRKELMSEARHQVDAIRSNWYQAVEREKEAFLQDLRQRTGEQTCAVARRALKDLGNAELEHHVVRVFIERLRSLDEGERKALRESVRQSKPEVTITSAFQIPQEMSEKIEQVLQEHISDRIDLEFEMSPDVICGIELRAHGRKIAWSVRDYLEGLETILAEILRGETVKLGEQQPSEENGEDFRETGKRKEERLVVEKE